MAEKSKKDKELTELQSVLRTEIGSLRKNFQSMIELYKTNIEAEMINAITVLSATDEEDQPKCCRDRKELEFMIESIQSMKYKPEKGRMKDLRKIHYVTKLLASRFSE